MSRPDQSFYLAHFTKGGERDSEQASALENLVKILSEKRIRAFQLPWTNKAAVCFTECPWGSLLRHAERYSPYGIGFKKGSIYACGGNPVIYANPNLFKSQSWGEEAYPFLTPFVPLYAPDYIKNLAPFNGKAIDYTHEREWRIPKDFSFQYKSISFVILKSVVDLELIPAEIKNEIGIEKFIFMDTYKKIEELWPTHIME